MGRHPAHCSRRRQPPPSSLDFVISDDDDVVVQVPPNVNTDSPPVASTSQQQQDSTTTSSISASQPSSCVAVSAITPAQDDAQESEEIKCSHLCVFFEALQLSMLSHSFWLNSEIAHFLIM